MKNLKTWAFAMMILFVGTTLTSCLNSDDSAPQGIARGMLSAGGLYLYTDDGFTLNIQNPTAMKLTDGTYPDRVVIVFSMMDGEDFESGKTKYNVNFDYYSSIMGMCEFSEEPVEQNTPIVALKGLTSGQGYLDVWARYYYDKESALSDFTLYADRVEDGTLVFKFVQSGKVVNKYEETDTAFSFDLPYRNYIETEFPDVKFFGTTNDSISVKVVANDTGAELSQGPIKVKIQY
ncbi:hypothetical protein D0T50_01220 [Bacteroides sp. 214]|uniref:hypothetical protein n=1 Tax=Bacteroides sp. 214 TaxID=2302935 RepID=UPI0013D050F3|nr:hypothetical protein [Bacteroides sp. 214]NDW11508.1 hypothetical protein [Bacteroides sp. 214]